MSKIKSTVSEKVLKTVLPWEKAIKTARWARTMTKVRITLGAKAAVKWHFVEFGGLTGAESRGIIDFVAIRKNHKEVKGLKRGDLLDLILIQTKGGTATRPTASDTARLKKVAKHHNAKSVVLAEWKRGKAANLYLLSGEKWVPASPSEIFA